MKSFKDARLIPPDGTFYALPDLRAFNNSSVEISKFLLQKALVVTVPGKEFGMEGHIRLSFSGTVKDITEGMARIKWALDPSSPNEIYIGDRKLVRAWRWRIFLISKPPPRAPLRLVKRITAFRIMG